MSFWPFGQSLNNSNVNKILDEYFSVLRSLEKSNPAVAASVQQNFSGSGEDNDRRGRDEISSVDLNRSPTGGSRSETDSGSTSLSSRTDLDDDDIASATAPMVVTIQSLNSSYIERLLEEPELLNELTRQNSNLLDFICFGFFYDSKSHVKVQHMDYLIDQMIDCMDKISDDALIQKKESSVATSKRVEDNVNGEDEDDVSAENSDNENNEQKYLNRANLISEIFSLDIWLITESLIKDDTYLSKIWCILKHPNLRTENSSLVPIFLKISQNLLASRKDQYLNFIRSKDDLVDDMLKHVDISALMDFLLKCIATDKVEAPTGIIELVDDQKLVPKCLEFLDNKEYGPDIQACAGDFLKALIAISANAPLDDMSIGPNCLTRQLASQDSIEKFVDIIVKRRGSALNITVSIVIELIRKNNSDYDQVNLLTTTLDANPPSNRDPIYLGYMLRHFAQSLPALFQIILDADADTSRPMLENQLHERFRPLGFERFKIVELIAELLHCSNMGLMNSKKAERIARERDNARGQLEIRLQDALEDLSIEDRTNGNKPEPWTDKNDDQASANFDGQDNDNEHDKDDDDNDVNENALISRDGEPENQQSSDAAAETDLDFDDEEIDESFEIPYVNENQNLKLRKNPTIGDLFKIKLYDTQVLPKIIQLFLSHPWNNFWHNVIFDIIQQIYNGRMDFSYNSFLVYSLFNLNGSRKFMPKENADVAETKDFSLTKDFILQGYQSSYTFYEKRHTNLGYMGHLVLIAEEVVKFSKLYKVELISPDIHETLSDQGWRFYAEDVLNDTRLMYSKILGGGNYVDDGNGNIIPQLPESPPAQATDSHDAAESESEAKGGGLINVESLEEQLGLSTESDLHEKLREILIANSQNEVEKKNKANGVIILGPPPHSEGDSGATLS